MSCVDTGPFNGGVYNDSTIINPDITKGTATNIEIKSSSLTGGVSVDNITANQLMQAIQEQNPVFLADKPQSSTGIDLPTEIVGEDRSQVLGKPAGFIKLGAYMVPVYRAK